MAGTVLTDGEDGPRIERPQRNHRPSAALLAHSEQAAIASQQKAVNDFRAAEAAKRASATALALAAARANKSTTPSSSRATSPDDTPLTQPIPSTLHIADKTKRARVEEISDEEDSDDEERENARINPKPTGECNIMVFKILRLTEKLLAKKARRSTISSEPEPVDEDGILVDVEVQSVGDDSVSTREGKTADIEQFFGSAYEYAGANGKVKKHRKCKICV